MISCILYGRFDDKTFGTATFSELPKIGHWVEFVKGDGLLCGKVSHIKWVSGDRIQDSVLMIPQLTLEDIRDISNAGGSRSRKPKDKICK